MSNERADFFSMTSSDGFRVINHNERDFDAFKALQSEIDEKFEPLEREKRRRDTIEGRRRALAAWDEHWKRTPWRDVTLKNVRRQGVVPHVESLLKDKEGPRTLFIEGGPGTGKTVLALAAARRLVGRGDLDLDTFFMSTETTALGHLREGFQGVDALRQYSSKKVRCYLLEGVSASAQYQPREQLFYEELLNHVLRSGAYLILSSDKSLGSFSGKVSTTAETRLGMYFKDRVVNLNTEDGLPGPLSAEERREVGDEDARMEGLDKFKKSTRRRERR